MAYRSGGCHVTKLNTHTHTRAREAGPCRHSTAVMVILAAAAAVVRAAGRENGRRTYYFFLHTPGPPFRGVVVGVPVDRRRVPAAAFRSQTLHDPATPSDRFGPRFLEPLPPPLPRPPPTSPPPRRKNHTHTRAPRGDCARRLNRVRHTRFFFSISIRVCIFFSLIYAAVVGHLDPIHHHHRSRRRHLAYRAHLPAFRRIPVVGGGGGGNDLFSVFRVKRTGTTAPERRGQDRNTAAAAAFPSKK